MTKILVLEKNESVYDLPFKQYGEITHNAKELEDCDLVVFTGGSDVSPEIYGDGKHLTTDNNEERDAFERVIYTKAHLLEIPMVGICRGAQFLNVMNGGLLIQHVNNHSIIGTHPLVTTDMGTINVTSTHHQMILPKRHHEILGWANGLATFYEGGGKIDIAEHGSDLFDGVNFIEPDCLWWKDTNCLGVQYHPEYMNEDSDGWKYFQLLLKKYIFIF